MSRILNLSRISDLVNNGDILKLWGVGFLIGVSRWAEILVLGIYTYQKTGSAFFVALLAFLNWIPNTLFGALIGALAERVNRRWLLFASTSFCCVLAGLLTCLSFANRVELWHIGFATFLNGLVWATEYPVRRTLLGETAGIHRAASALSIDMAIGTSTMALGSLIAGLLMDAYELYALYLVTASLFLTASILVASVRYAMPPGNEARAAFFQSMRQGLNHIIGSPPVAGILLITIIVNFFGFSFISMLPVIGASKLQVGPNLVGILRSMEGAGAFLSLLVLTIVARPQYYMRIFMVGAFSFLVSIIIFSALHWFWLCLIVLFLSGVGEAGFAAMQASMTFIVTPAYMRSRIMGLLAVCVGFGPLGVLHTGAMAEWLGADVAVRVVAIEGVFCYFACLWLLPALRR